MSIKLRVLLKGFDPRQEGGTFDDWLIDNNAEPYIDATAVVERKGSWGKSMEGIEGAIECLNAGEALMFVDAIMHGSAERVNPGQRRVAV